MKIGDSERPWNAKVPKGRAAPNPQNHPYTLWANTPIGEGQVGCIYSAQGFEFDSVGVIWGRDLVWRTDRWVAQPKESRDSPVRNAGENMLDLVRNAYRVLLTRGIRETTRHKSKRFHTRIRYKSPHALVIQLKSGEVMKNSQTSTPSRPNIEPLARPGVQPSAQFEHTPAPPHDQELFGRVASILEQARGNVVRAVNHNMVVAYWLIGREIVMELQRGQERAGYGERLLEELSVRLTLAYGKGYSVVTLRAFRQFYTAFPQYVCNRTATNTDDEQPASEIRFPSGSELRFCGESALTWSHYRALMRVHNPAARLFYEKEAATSGWSKSELERQIHTHYYERLLATQGKRGTSAEEEVLNGDPDSNPLSRTDLSSQTNLAPPQTNPLDLLKDPYVLEFLDIPDAVAMHESGLEGAIIAHLRDFLLELGKGFAFVARQKRLSFEDQHLYVDLVFYSIPLRCYLLIELKTGKLTHADVGQMDGYVRMFDDLMASSEDNPTIGLILCTEHNSAVAKYSVLNDRHQVFASRYMTCLPTEAELAAEIQRTRALLEARTDKR